MPPLLQKLPGKRDGGWGQKVSLCRFLADHKIASSWKKRELFVASYSTSNKLLLVFRHILTTGWGEGGGVDSPPERDWRTDN